MPSDATRQDAQAYAPTSLDFINRPNPVEPLAAPSEHPLHGTAQLHNTYAHDLRRLLLDTVPRDAAGEAASKRRRPEDEVHGRNTGNGQARDLPSLPKLPVRRLGVACPNRHRMPDCYLRSVSSSLDSLTGPLVRLSQSQGTSTLLLTLALLVSLLHLQVRLQVPIVPLASQRLESTPKTSGLKRRPQTCSKV
jgi:hypothetical protein